MPKKVRPLKNMVLSGGGAAPTWRGEEQGHESKGLRFGIRHHGTLSMAVYHVLCHQIRYP
jgi:hypothetical protein